MSENVCGMINGMWSWQWRKRTFSKGAFESFESNKHFQILKTGNPDLVLQKNLKKWTCQLWLKAERSSQNRTKTFCDKQIEAIISILKNQCSDSRLLWQGTLWRKSHQIIGGFSDHSTLLTVELYHFSAVKCELKFYDHNSFAGFMSGNHDWSWT